MRRYWLLFLFLSIQSVNQLLHPMHLLLLFFSQFSHLFVQHASLAALNLQIPNGLPNGY